MDIPGWPSSLGHYRNGEQAYRANLLPIVEIHFSGDGLPDDHGVEMYVAQDGQRRYATRQTVTGWWLAIGAAGPPPDQWLYDGPIHLRDFRPNRNGIGSEEVQARSTGIENPGLADEIPQSRHFSFLWLALL